MFIKTFCFVSLLLFGCAVQVEVEESVEETKPQQKTVYSNTQSSQETTCFSEVVLTTETGEKVVLNLKCAKTGTKDIVSDNWGSENQINVNDLHYVRPPSPGDPR